MTHVKPYPFAYRDVKKLSRLSTSLICFILMALISKPALAQPGRLDLSFNANDNGTNIEQGANNDVYTIAVQPDGKILIGGLFTAFSGTTANYLARLNADGSKDQSFNAGGSGLNAFANKILLQPDGKIIVAGAFTAYNGVASNYIIRLNADGSKDASFSIGTGFNAEVKALALQADGKILAGGSFTNYNAIAASHIVRLTTNGTKDVAFNSTVTAIDSTVNDIVVQSNGKIVVGKDNEPLGVPKDYISRINPNGTNDGTYHVEGTGIAYSVKALALQPDGKVLAGSYDPNAAPEQLKLKRLNDGGTPDPTFSTTYSNVRMIVLQNDGKILVGCGIPKSNFSYNEGYKVARLNSNGVRDESFKYDLHEYYNNNVYAIALQTDGRILVGETFNATYIVRFGDYVKREIDAASKNFRINRYNADGSREQQFCINPLQTGANKPIYKTVIQPDGKILIGGSFFNYNGAVTNYFTRLNADGTKDASFSGAGTGPNTLVEAITLQNDGKILIGGIFSTYNGIPVQGLVRLNTDGSIDPSFNFSVTTNSPIRICAITLQPDGKILVGGYNQLALFRLNADGSRDNSFAHNIGVYYHQLYPAVTKIIVQADGKLLVGGAFAEGTDYHTWNKSLVRLNADGSRDISWNQNGIGGSLTSPSGISGAVNTIVLLNSGKVLITGSFDGYSSATSPSSSKNVCVLNADGGADNTFNTGGVGTNGPVIDAQLLPDGKVLLAGDFTSYDGIPTSRLIRINADGTLDPSFIFSEGANNIISSFAFLPDGKKLIVGGNFTSYRGTQRTRLARIYYNTNEVTTSTTNIAVCSGQLPYTWNGNSYNAAGTYTVTLTNASGNDSIATLILGINVSGGITGPDKVCQYTGTPNSASYSIAAPTGSTLTWSVSKPATMIITGGQGTGVVNIQYTSDFTSGTIYVRIVNATCGIDIKPSLSISKTLPATPGVITASTASLCAFIGTANIVTYSIRKVSSATSYNWITPAGTTSIVHANGPGINDTIVYVSFAANFTTSPITVQSVNDCGMSGIRSLTISRTNPPTPGAISGPTNVCMYAIPGSSGTEYSVPEVAGMTYHWSVTGGAVMFYDGDPYPFVNIKFPPGFTTGVISVTATNGCGTSTVRNLTVRAIATSGPGSITVTNTSPCPSREYTYSIPSLPANASTLSWTVPTGATITAGQGTTSITVTYPSSAVTGYVTVQAFNNCSASSIRKLSINLPVCTPPAPFARIAGRENNPAKKNTELPSEKWDATIYPNPSISDFTLQVNTQSPERITVKIYEVQGRLIKEINLSENKIIHIGQELKPGTYLIEVRQGNQIKTTRALKF